MPPAPAPTNRDHPREKRPSERRKCELRSYVQELRRELNRLRTYALGHGDCDARLARYNQAQAERVLGEYYSACNGGLGSGMAMLSGPIKAEPQ